jgi:hypothetical protein
MEINRSGSQSSSIHLRGASIFAEKLRRDLPSLDYGTAGESAGQEGPADWFTGSSSETWSYDCGTFNLMAIQ